MELKLKILTWEKKKPFWEKSLFQIINIGQALQKFKPLA